MTFTSWLFAFLAGIAGGCVGYAFMSGFNAWHARRRFRRISRHQRQQHVKHSAMHVPRIHPRADINTRAAGYQWQPKPFDGMGSVDE